MFIVRNFLNLIPCMKSYQAHGYFGRCFKNTFSCRLRMIFFTQFWAVLRLVLTFQLAMMPSQNFMSKWNKCRQKNYTSCPCLLHYLCICFYQMKHLMILSSWQQWDLVFCIPLNWNCIFFQNWVRIETKDHVVIKVQIETALRSAWLHLQSSPKNWNSSLDDR